MTELTRQARDKWDAENAAREAAEDADPLFVFRMDGSAHFREAETGCCGSFSRPCKACRGAQHYQPVYGGYYFKCEACGAEDT